MVVGTCVSAAFLVVASIAACGSGDSAGNGKEDASAPSEVRGEGVAANGSVPDICMDGACQFTPAPDETPCGESSQPWAEDYQHCLQGNCCHPNGNWCWDGICDCEGSPMYGTCPTGDAGCPCTNAMQCQGLCVTEYDYNGDIPFPCDEDLSGTCAPYEPHLGCLCTLDENELVSFACWD